MKIEELRRGNLVFIQGEVKRVLGFFNEMARNSDEMVDFVQADNLLDYMPYDLQAIPLSEEILLKCGFEKTKTPMQFDIEYIDYRMGQYVLFILPKGKVEVEFCASHNKIEERGYLRTVEYLHQLQNLYFALTGQELNTSGLI